MARLGRATQPRRLIRRASTYAPVTVTPGGASLTLTGSAPAVTATANVTLTPGAATLTLTGSAPTVTATANKTVTPGAATLTLTGSAPTVTAGGNIVLTPGGATLTLTGSAPTVTATGNVTLTPGAASLGLTGSAPSLILTLRPGAASLTLTGSAPSVTATTNVTVTPGAASLTLTGSAPTVTAGGNVTVTPGAAGLTLTGSAPDVRATTPTTFDYGYCQSELSWGSAANMDEATIRRVLQVIKDLGGSRVRFGVQLGTIADTDRAVRLSREYGLKPLLCLINNQAFGYASSVESFGTFCRNVATRYGPAGSGDLQNTVTELELFNESNLSIFNAPQADPETYAKYLKSGYQAIKAVHPSCTVISGGTIPMSEVPFAGLNPVQWYTRVLAAGGGQWFDAWGFHLYATETPSPAMLQWTYLTGVRDLMVANGLGAKKAWITEVGVGFPAQGVTSLLMARDWLKIMIDGLLSYDWVDKFFIYNARCYSGGDGGGGSYGMVDINFNPRSPIYEYASTIVGAPADPEDALKPAPPTGLECTGVTSSTAGLVWDVSDPTDFVTNYRIYVNGAQAATSTDNAEVLIGLAPGTPYTDVTVTAVDAGGTESDPSDPVSFTTDAPTGSQALYSGAFSGSTVPNVFGQLGLGFTVTSGAALPNTSGSDGLFYTVVPNTLALRTPDHSVSIMQSTASAASDRFTLAAARISSDGATWVAGGIAGGRQSDAARIYTCVNGVVRLQKAANATPLLAGEWCNLVAEGDLYTLVRVTTAGDSIPILSWMDTTGAYTGTTNLIPGWVFRHKRSKSINYAPPGVTRWDFADLNPVLTAEVGNSDLWKIAIIKPSRLGLVISTGLWQTAL